LVDGTTARVVAAMIVRGSRRRIVQVRPARPVKNERDQADFDATFGAASDQRPKNS